jgi:hypothetical protein
MLIYIFKAGISNIRNEHIRGTFQITGARCEYNKFSVPCNFATLLKEVSERKIYLQVSKQRRRVTIQPDLPEGASDTSGYVDLSFSTKSVLL